MPALFPQRANFVLRAAIAAVLVIAVGAPVLAMVWVRTPVARGETRVVHQPVPFDHRVHAAGLKLDCRYCHSGADRSAHAGLPATRQCVGCHSATWMATDAFRPVRTSMATGAPISWKRVTWLPDFVYFQHAMHVNAKVSCQTCHGDVASMPIVKQAAPLTMKWCVDCHRSVPVPARARALTDCTTCHR